MASRQNITGIVESVALEEIDNSTYRHREFTVRIKVVITLADGRRAYIATKIADRTDDYYHPTSTEEKARAAGKLQWAYIADADRDKFGYTIGRNAPIAAVWRDDEITIAGIIEERTSAKGNDYLNVNRAVLIARRVESTRELAGVN